MNMREKIARAILKSNGDFGEALGFTWEDYLQDADAALSAMREPTDGMIEAGYGAHNNGSPRDRYTAMIDAALEGK